MPADTARSPEFMLTKLQASQPYPDSQTTALAQLTRDLITSIPDIGASSANFNFAAEYPKVISGGSVNASRQLFAGLSATVRFDRVPAGINGSDVAHYLYLVDSGGTSEAVLITGGTASVSNRTNATLIFTPANNHTGNQWYLISATAGIQETMVSTNSLVLLPTGVSTIYAPVNVLTDSAGVIGQGYDQSYIVAQFLNLNFFNIVAGGAHQFRNFTAYSALGTLTAGSIINVATTAALLTVSDMAFGANGNAACYVGVTIAVGTSRLWANDNWIHTRYRGMDIQSSFIQIHNLQVVNDRTNLNYVVNSAALALRNIAGGFISDLIQDAGAMAFGIIADIASAGFVNEISIKGLFLDHAVEKAIYVTPPGGGGGTAAHWEISAFRLYGTDTNWQGMFLPTGVLDWQISTGNIDYSSRGIEIEGAVDVTVNGVQISPSVVAATAAVAIANTGTPKDIRFIGCGIGTDQGVGVSGIGFTNSKTTLAGLALIGCQFDGSSQPNKLILVGDEVAPVISDPVGIVNVRKTVASAAALAFPVMGDDDVIELTGNTTITSVSGLREGQQGLLVATNAAPGGITQGNNIQSPTIANFTRYQVYHWVFTNSLFYLS